MDGSWHCFTKWDPSMIGLPLHGWKPRAETCCRMKTHWGIGPVDSCWPDVLVVWYFPLYSCDVQVFVFEWSFRSCYHQYIQSWWRPVPFYGGKGWQGQVSLFLTAMFTIRLWSPWSIFQNVSREQWRLLEHKRFISGFITPSNYRYIPLIKCTYYCGHSF